MERWSSEHRAFAVETFFKNGDSATVTQRVFRRHFNIGRNGKVPTRQTILNWVKQFRETASATSTKPPGRPRIVRTPENVERVREAILRSPQRSVRRHAPQLRMSDRSVRRILHFDLNFHPYKMQLVHELKPQDLNQRAHFCGRLLDFINEQPDFLSNLIMSDEAHFHINGAVNRHNCRYWAPQNPQMTHELPLHSPKVTVWCGVSGFGIIGPYFFQNDNDQTVTVNSQRYVAMLRDFLLPQLRRRRLLRRQLWFQQDGATSHTARESMRTVNDMFPGRIMSRNGNVNWPPRSPDLSVCDFFLWGYLKQKVYATRPHTLHELREAIQTAIQQIPMDMLRKAMDAVRKRAEICLENNGAHPSKILFKT